MCTNNKSLYVTPGSYRSRNTNDDKYRQPWQAQLSVTLAYDVKVTQTQHIELLLVQI